MVKAKSILLWFFLIITACSQGELPPSDPTAAPPTKFARVPTDYSTATRQIPTRTPTARITSPPTPKKTATPTPQPKRTLTPSPTLKGPDTGTVLAPSALAALLVDPRTMLAGKTSFFTSVCFGKDANPLQEEDHIDGADWASAQRAKCVFGYGVNPVNRLPTGRYKVLDSPDGQRRFYLIPPEAFAGDSQSIKELSQMQLIVDPAQGCVSLGSIGITADGVNYRCNACSFLKPGGICPATNAPRGIVLPVNENNILDPTDNGGAYGFLAFPAVIFKNGFSLYFTGKDGYPPSRIYFENVVDTLLPGINLKTTAEMTDQEVRDIAAQFDNLLSGADPKSQLALLETEAKATTPTQVLARPKQEIVFGFSTKPGVVLSSIAWMIKPVNEIRTQQFMETNLCVIISGREICFTGVEDFAHCAFFTPCTTGYSTLKPIGGEGYIATRYFPAGTAPIISDGKVTIRIQAPDIGTTLEMELKVRVRDIGSTLPK